MLLKIQQASSLENYHLWFSSIHQTGYRETFPVKRIEYILLMLTSLYQSSIQALLAPNQTPGV